MTDEYKVVRAADKFAIGQRIDELRSLLDQILNSENDDLNIPDIINGRIQELTAKRIKLGGPEW